LNITLYGEVSKENLVLRKGASSGEFIYVTGKPGESQAGLELLVNKGKNYSEAEDKLVKAHKAPYVRNMMVSALLKKFKPTAMIDISDGLLSDLRHICERSSAGFLLKEEQLPFSSELAEYCKKNGHKTTDYVLGSGEEYELLFTSKISPEELGDLSCLGVQVTHIGEMTDRYYKISSNGNISDVEIKGFDHFS
jgi:thiamine-monophosphate kinase